MYANGRFWEAKLKGAGGVAWSRGKEGLFWSKDPGTAIVGHIRIIYVSPVTCQPLHSVMG